MRGAWKKGFLGFVEKRGCHMKLRLLLLVSE